MNIKNDAKTIFFDVDDTLYDHLQPLREGVAGCSRPIG